MRVRPTGEWRNRSLGGLTLTAVLLLPGAADAQVSFQSQRSQAPSFGTTAQADPLADATGGDTAPSRVTGNGATDTGAGLPASGDTSGGESGAEEGRRRLREER